MRTTTPSSRREPPAVIGRGLALFRGGTEVPRRGPSPLLGHAWRRSEGARMGDGRDKPGLKPHSALFRLLLFAGGTEVPRRGPSPLLGHAWRRSEGARMGDGRDKPGLRPHSVSLRLL